MALSRPLERDRAVDESGHQVAGFGRLGSRPLTLKEMQKLYLDRDGKLYTVKDRIQKQDFLPAPKTPPVRRPSAAEAPAAK
jgi:hypothetical protein